MKGSTMYHLLGIIAQGDGAGSADLSGLTSKIQLWTEQAKQLGIAACVLVIVAGTIWQLVANITDIPPPRVLFKPTKGAALTAAVIGAAAGIVAFAQSVGASIFG